MSRRYSRAMSTATAAYAVFALSKPEHIGNAMEADAGEQEFYDKLARGYGVRDLVLSGLALAGPAGAARAAMGLRIANDLADGAFLSLRAPSSQVRGKVLAATLGWAALNGAALALDRRRS